MSYDCPHCDAVDSTRCAFRVDETTGSVVPSQQRAAREARCRVMHYTDCKEKEDAAELAAQR
jgi:hypothetical protein